MTVDREKFPVRATWEEDGFTVEIEGGETVVLNTDWTVGEPMMLTDIGGKEVTVQVDGGGFREAYIMPAYNLEYISSHEHTSINPEHNT